MWLLIVIVFLGLAFLLIAQALKIHELQSANRSLEIERDNILKQLRAEQERNDQPQFLRKRQRG